MAKWHKTGCVLCAQNCGIEVLVKNNQMQKVRPDKENPRSKGYICRKGLNVMHHQHHADRLTHPLKRTKKGFIRISWKQAIREISTKLNRIIQKNSPKSLAYVGGGGQGCHFEAFFGPMLLRELGSKYHYNALAAELTGYFWVNGRMTGSQNRFLVPDEEAADMLLAIGWNGMESHQMPRAPLVLREFAQNPDKMLAVIDPRRSETAKIANLHLALQPGTDALLLRTMIALILANKWEKKDYLKAFTHGFESIRPWFEGLDIQEALKVCGLERAPVEKLCHKLVTRNWCVHSDLGILMNRHSTVTSYLLMLLTAVCGRICVPGGNIIPGRILPLGLHTDERHPANWRTQTTGYPAISGLYPPNVIPEEILSDDPERLRALIICGANPLRSYADTTAYEKAFQKLELAVTIELSMTETAQLSDYVLPARSAYESWDGTFFSWTYPEIFFQMRRPIIKPEGIPLECGEILTRLADGLGLIPALPKSLYTAAKGQWWEYTAELGNFLQKNLNAVQTLPFILAKTLGRALKSAHKAMLWGMTRAVLVSYRSPSGALWDGDEVFTKFADGDALIPEHPTEHLMGMPLYLAKQFTSPKFFQTLAIAYGMTRVRPSDFSKYAAQKGFSMLNSTKSITQPAYLLNVARKVLQDKSLFPLAGLNPLLMLAENMYQTILDHPQGLILGQMAPDANMKEIRTAHGKIELHIPELEEWLTRITPATEAESLRPDPQYPMLLMAGRHMKTNANTLMRNPDWNRKLRACTLSMNPKDAARLKLEDGQMVRVCTQAGEEEIELEVTTITREGQVLMPHGFGLQYKGQKFGANANRLTSGTHRDPWAGTPYHRYVPCRIEPLEEKVS